MYFKHARIVLVIMSLSSLAIAQPYIGLPDSIIFGNLDGSIIEAVSGRQFSLPVWIKTDDSVCFIQSYPASNDSFIISRDGGMVFWPLTQWDEAAFSVSEPSVRPNWTVQDFIGYLVEPHSSPYILYTNYQWVHIADLFLTAGTDTSLLGMTSTLDEIAGPLIEKTWFGMSDGFSGESPDLIFGGFHLTTTPNIPGDTNGDCNVNGIDVVYLVNYLKGIGSPPVWGGCQ